MKIKIFILKIKISFLKIKILILKIKMAIFVSLFAFKISGNEEKWSFGKLNLKLKGIKSTTILLNESNYRAQDWLKLSATTRRYFSSRNDSRSDVHSREVLFFCFYCIPPTEKKSPKFHEIFINCSKWNDFVGNTLKILIQFLDFEVNFQFISF